LTQLIPDGKGGHIQELGEGVIGGEPKGGGTEKLVILFIYILYIHINFIL
jgi:hypothetical protein